MGKNDPRVGREQLRIGFDVAEDTISDAFDNALRYARLSSDERKGDLVHQCPQHGPLARAACVLLGCVLAACKGGGGGGDRPVPAVQADVASMDAIGDSITKGFNAVSDGEFCPESDIENRNWSTGDTHGAKLCSDGGAGVFSHA